MGFSAVVGVKDLNMPNFGFYHWEILGMEYFLEVLYIERI